MVATKKSNTNEEDLDDDNVVIKEVETDKNV